MTQTQEQTTQQITSQLNLKFVAAYFKRAHKERDIRVQRREDGSLYISDGMIAVIVPYVTAEIPFSAFDSKWERATFRSNNLTAEEQGPDIEALFRSYDSSLMLNTHVLTLTPFLLEQPGARNKPGEFSRKLFFMGTDNAPDEVIHTDVYIDKREMDMLNSDLDALKGFLFETSGHEKPVRVSAVNGIVAYLMPKCNIQRYLEVNY